MMNGYSWTVSSTLFSSFDTSLPDTTLRPTEKKTRSETTQPSRETPTQGRKNDDFFYITTLGQPMDEWQNSFISKYKRKRG